LYRLPYFYFIHNTNTNTKSLVGLQLKHMALYTYIFEGALVHALYTALTICINNCMRLMYQTSNLEDKNMKY